MEEREFTSLSFHIQFRWIPSLSLRLSLHLHPYRVSLDLRQAQILLISGLSVACSGPSINFFSLGSSSSAFLQHGSSLQSNISGGYHLKSRSFGVSARAATGKSVHDFTVKDIDGKVVSLSKFKGKVLLLLQNAL